MTAGEAAPPRVTSAGADRAVDTLVRRLAGVGLLPADARFDADAFHALRDRVRASFSVPQTSVTPVMSRLLFAIGDASAARRILVVGSYHGNTLVWLAGRALLDGVSGDSALVGADVDTGACAGAAENFRRLGGRAPVTIEPRDGAEVLAAGGAWDLLLLDADCPRTRKAVYLPLLRAAQPRLRPGALVLAHDTALPVFAEQLRPYREAVADRTAFAGSVHLPVDACGLELSVTARREAGEPTDSGAPHARDAGDAGDAGDPGGAGSAVDTSGTSGTSDTSETSDARDARELP